MTIKREGPSGEALAKAFSESLRPGEYGTPIIEKFDHNEEEKRTQFIVRSDDIAKDPHVYLVVVYEFDVMPVEPLADQED